jgi:hypothetical protein
VSSLKDLLAQQEERFEVERVVLQWQVCWNRRANTCVIMQLGFCLRSGVKRRQGQCSSRLLRAALGRHQVG